MDAMSDAAAAAALVLCEACQSGDAEKVAAALHRSSGASSHTPTVDTPVLLMIAAEHGHVDVAKLLLDFGADPNTRDGVGATPLHVAAQRGYADVVALLLQNFAIVDAADTCGETALHYAARRGHADVVEVLIESAANVNAADFNGSTGLHHAARYGNESVVGVLLRSKATADSRDIDAKTPLSIAVQADRTSIVVMLLYAEASTNVQTVNGDTVLISAAANVGVTMFDLIAREHLSDPTFDKATSILQTLREYVRDVYEFENLWSYVVDRLATIKAQLQVTDKGIEKRSDVTHQFIMIMFRLVKLKVVCSTSSVYLRLASDEQRRLEW